LTSLAAGKNQFFQTNFNIFKKFQFFQKISNFSKKILKKNIEKINEILIFQKMSNFSKNVKFFKKKIIFFQKMQEAIPGSFWEFLRRSQMSKDGQKSSSSSSYGPTAHVDQPCGW